MPEKEAFNPDKIEVIRKGPMTLYYASTGSAEAKHMASFFHDEKSDWVLEAIKAHYGIKVVKKRPTAEEVTTDSPAPKATKAKAAAKAPVVAKKRPVRRKK